MEVIYNRVIEDGGLSLRHGCLALELRLPWYRSLPLSTVEVCALEICGAPVSLADVAFELEGKAYPVSALEEQTDHGWYVLDSAYLLIDPALLGDGLGDGAAVDFAVTLTLYPPYIHGLVRPVRHSKSLSLTTGAIHA